MYTTSKAAMLIVFAVLEALALRVRNIVRLMKPAKHNHTHTPEVDRAIADADNVREQMKKKIAA